MDIKPALTPKEWKDAREFTIPAVLVSGVEFYVSGEDAAFAVMAELNDALPDDDPRKITREDVEALQLADERIRAEWDHPNNPEPPTLRNLAAKLAALLPPNA